MLIQSTLAAMVKAVEWGSLAKVALDGSHTLFYKSCYLLLIPIDGLGIGKV